MGHGIPLYRTSRIAGNVPVVAGSVLRQPPHPLGVRRWVPSGRATTLPQCSGDSAVSLAPYVRRDVRLADLQVGGTVFERGGCVNAVGKELGEC